MTNPRYRDRPTFRRPHFERLEARQMLSIVSPIETPPVETLLVETSLAATGPDSNPSALESAPLGTPAEAKGGTLLVRFELTDPDNEPMSSVNLGEQFLMHAYIQDMRDPAEGVFQAYLDIYFDDTLVSIAGPVTHGSQYSDFAYAFLDTPGLIDEAGGAIRMVEPPDDPAAEYLLLTVPFQADSLGTFTFAATPANETGDEIRLWDGIWTTRPDSILFVGVYEELLIIEENHRPAMEDRQLAVPENSPVGTLVGTVEAVDQEAPPQNLTYVITAGNESGTFAIDPTTGDITVADPSELDHEAAPNLTLIVEATDDGSPPLSASAVVTVVVTDVTEATVVGRRLFYNGSGFDGNDGSANLFDDAAIATDKTALLPGQTATSANYTSYILGINGLMIDLQGQIGTLGVDDFRFRIGNDDRPEGWSPAPQPSGMQVRHGAGDGSFARVSFVWDDYAITDRWLQVIVLATSETGLSQPDVFYFGNAPGESGNSDSDAKVNAIDMLMARNNRRGYRDPAGIEFPYDFDRDARVNAVDMLIARNSQTHFLNALKLIAIPGGISATLEPAASDAWDWLSQIEQNPPTPEERSAEGAVDLLLLPDIGS